MGALRPFCFSGRVLPSEEIMSEKLKREFHAFKLLLSSVPSYVTVGFVMSVFAMNLLANKSIDIPLGWLALDCGIIVSWAAFLTMDMVTKHFGPKAATELSLFAIAMNLVFCLLLYLGSVIPGVWGESYVEGSENILNTALDNTFGGTWYVLVGSTVKSYLAWLMDAGRIDAIAEDGMILWREA